MHHEDCALKADTDAGSSKDLVSEPLCEGCVDVIGCDEAGADGEEGHAEHHEGCVEADGGDEAAGYD